MAFVVGLDLGTRTIKGAVFTGSPRSFRLVDFFVEDIPLLQDTQVALGSANGGGTGAEFEEILSPEEILHRVLESRKLARADIYAALDAKDCGIRDVPFPYTREDQIQKTVAFEAEQYFHTFDLDDVTLEWVKVGESDGRSQLVLIAAHNPDIEERLALLKRAEVDPVALDLDSAALANAFTLSPQYDETKNTLLVDMGATSTKIVLLEAGKLKKIRSLRTGSTVLDPGRMIPEPLAVDATGELVDGGRSENEGDSAFEGRFREFENAVRDLELAAGDLFDSGSDLGGGESRQDAPIAILTDEEYERVEGAMSEVRTDAALAAETAETAAEVAETERPETEIELAGIDSPEAVAAAASPEAESSGAEESGGAAGSEAESNLPDSGVAAGGAQDETQDYEDYLDRVSVEIQRTLATTQLEGPIEVICLTGGMSRREHARRYFEDAFGIETVRLDFREGLETDLDSSQLDLVSSEGAVAVGLAAKGLGKDLVGLDFRKGPFRYEHRLERVRMPLLLCSILCFLVFLQTALWSFHRSRYLGDHAAAYEAGGARIYKTFFDTDPIPGLPLVSSAERQRKKWEAGGLSDVGRFLPYVEVVRDVSKVLADTGLYFKLGSMNYKFELRKRGATGRDKKEQWTATDSQLVLQAEEDDAWLKIENAFTRSKFFDAAAASKPEAKGGYRITLKLKVAERVLNAPASGPVARK